MQHDKQTELGTLIRERRRSLGITIDALAAGTGVVKSVIHRIEDGTTQQPQPQTLAVIAAAIDLPVADLFALIGYTTPHELPTLRPYLRLKYGALPEEALLEVEDYLTRVAAQ